MSLANNARRTLIRFGKVCPFVICFIVLISDVENIIAITTQDIVVYADNPIYNTPISFAIARYAEYDILVVFIVGLISISIEACVYNTSAVLYIGLLLYRNHWFAVNEPCEDVTYMIVMCLSSAVLLYFIYKGLKIFISK